MDKSFAEVLLAGGIPLTDEFPLKIMELIKGCREDAYAIRVPSGNTNKMIYKPFSKQLTPESIKNHISGDGPNIGVYPLKAGSSHTPFLVYDLDDHSGKRRLEVENALIDTTFALKKAGIKFVVFRSGGGKGFHIWILLETPQSAAIVRAYAQDILGIIGYKEGNGGVENKEIEIFPKQDKVSMKGYGNLIAVPLGRNSVPVVIRGDEIVDLPKAEALNILFEYNPPFPAINIPPAEEKKYKNIPLDIAIVQEALSFIPSDDYHIWIKIGLALKSAFPGIEGEEVFIEWSRTSEKFEERTTLYNWEKFSPHSLTIGTIIAIARQYGWKGQTGNSLYFAQDDGMYYRQQTKEGYLPVKLTNFVAHITREIKMDDGESTPVRYVEVDSPSLGRAIIPAKDFQSLSWLLDVFGPKAITYVMNNSKAHVATAIQTLSGEIPVETIYIHTGWRLIDNDMYFLHAGGAIGKNGHREDVTVKLNDSLAPLTLPIPRDIRKAIMASLSLLRMGPAHVTYPLLAAIYRAPLCEFYPATFSLFIEGDSGTFKSAVSGIAQAHFGARYAEGKGFPANWTSTPNAIEHIIFIAKDMVAVIDDFAPNGQSIDIQRLNYAADRVLRGQGNLTGRQRLTQTSTLKPEMHARGLVVSSGEDIPRGKSLRARMLVIPLQKGDISTAILSEMQQYGRDGLLAESMAAYIQWLANKAQTLKNELMQRHGEIRDQNSGNHARTPDNIASLALGLEQFLAFAVDHKVISSDETKNYLSAALTVLQQRAISQEEEIRDEDPVVYFFDLLRSALTSGRAHLLSTAGGEPEIPGACGWQQREIPTSDGPQTMWQPKGDCIGWINKNDLYLAPEAAYTIIQTLARTQGKSIPINRTTLAKRMMERKMLLSSDLDRTTLRIHLVGQRCRVWHIASSKLGIASCHPDDAVL